VDISGYTQQLFVRFDEDGFEATLEQVSLSITLEVDPLGVPEFHVMDNRRERGIKSLYFQMSMVGYEAL
jgi:hypothetical protein